MVEKLGTMSLRRVIERTNARRDGPDGPAVKALAAQPVYVVIGISGGLANWQNGQFATCVLVAAITTALHTHPARRHTQPAR